jgi:hypothetical protein
MRFGCLPWNPISLLKQILDWIVRNWVIIITIIIITITIIAIINVRSK